MGGQDMQFYTAFPGRPRLPRPFFQEIRIFSDESECILVHGFQKSQVCRNPLINKLVIIAGLEYKYSRIF